MHCAGIEINRQSFTTAWENVVSAASWVANKTVVVLDSVRKNPGNGDEFARAFKNVTLAWDQFHGTDTFGVARGRVDTISAFVDGVGVLGIPERALTWYRDIGQMMEQKKEGYKGKTFLDIPKTVIKMVSEVPLTVFEVSSAVSLSEKLGLHSFGEFGDKLVGWIQAGSITTFFAVDTVGQGYSVYQAVQMYEEQNNFDEDDTAWSKAKGFLSEPTRWLPQSLQGAHRVAAIVSIVAGVCFAAVFSSPVLITFGLIASGLGVTAIVADVVVTSMQKDRNAEVVIGLKSVDREFVKSQNGQDYNFSQAEHDFLCAERAAYRTHSTAYNDKIEAARGKVNAMRPTDVDGDNDDSER